jgi:hypothetical protein
MANPHNTVVNAPTVVTGKGTLPTAVQITGTITSTGTRVVGSSTLFTTQLKQGDYIYNTTAATLSEVRCVKHILDNTHLILESAFSVDVSAINTYRVRGQYKSVSVANTGGSAGLWAEGTIAAGASPSHEAKPGFVVEPLAYNATGTSFNIHTSTSL